MRYTRTLCMLCLTLPGWHLSFGQKGLNSIYSAYGIGDYQMRDQHAYAGMGGTGVALPSTYSINETNPASFAWLPKNSLKFELTLGGLSTRYINEQVNTAAGNFSISRVALSAQLVGPVRTVVGLRRFSQVEYYTTAFRDIAGSENQLPMSVEGEGGLYQIYVGNALPIVRNLSLGFNTGFIFGSINSKESLIFSQDESLIAEHNKYYNQASFTAGLQYRINGKNNHWMLGAFYEPQIKLKVLEQTTLKDQSEQVIAAKDDIYGKFIYPQKFGAGISFSRSSFTASIDMIGHLWSSTGYSGNHFTTTDAYSFAGGIKHQFTRTTLWGPAPGISIQAGFNRDQNYLVINGRQLVSNAFTLGMSFPSKSRLSFYSVGCKIGSRGTATYPLVKENFFEFNFTLSLGALMYKDKKYD